MPAEALAKVGEAGGESSLPCNHNMEEMRQ
jgi:hypothetical protein